MIIMCGCIRTLILVGQWTSVKWLRQPLPTLNYCHILLQREKTSTLGLQWMEVTWDKNFPPWSFPCNMESATFCKYWFHHFKPCLIFYQCLHFRDTQRLPDIKFLAYETVLILSEGVDVPKATTFQPSFNLYLWHHHELRLSTKIVDKTPTPKYPCSSEWVIICRERE